MFIKFITVLFLHHQTECQAELGLEEARSTCDQTYCLLNFYDTIKEDVKNGFIGRLVRAIVKLVTKDFKGFPEIKVQYELPNSGNRCTSLFQTKI